ncbi:MAG: DUF4421 domain-containing protein [Chitinophagales bacterium]|nr:DUF4421 domain-containing protein [Chitinophagales bacterium]MDW8428756.1 DUF4421 family protein [Chitinophagales bacterium]
MPYSSHFHLIASKRLTLALYHRSNFLSSLLVLGVGGLPSGDAPNLLRTAILGTGSIVLLFIGAVCFDLCAHAQEKTELPFFKPFRTDTAYISAAEPWTLRLYAVNKHFNLRYGTLVSNQRMFLDPDRSIAAGLGVSRYLLALDLGLEIGRTRQKTKALVLFSNLFYGPHNLQLNAQQYTGFSKQAQQPLTSPVFDSSLRSRLIYLSYLHYFNYTRYSSPAPLTGTQRQLRSAGSPSFGAFLLLHALSSAVPVFPDTFLPMPEWLATATRTTIFSGGIMGGYGFTFVLPKSLFVNAAAALGVSPAVTHWADALYNLNSQQTLGWLVQAQAAAGYHGPCYYALITLQHVASYFPSQAVPATQLNLEKYKIAVGRKL